MTQESDDGGSSETQATAVIYLRVSTKEQAEKGGEAEGYSIPAQREACRRKAASLQAAVIEEFPERGESAKTADRPELQRMLQFVKDNRVKYVIVHKVDRLARNRADDVVINLALKQAGAELVSVSENIDQTPSGLLLHGIMSSIAEFYSRNLAAEVIKGSTQKAKNGGTPTRAPLGYRNVRHMDNGYEVRTVEVDAERGPLMAWAFEAYATGDWTILTLLAELTRRGLTTAPGPKTPSKQLSDSQLHALLRHPYYMGLVRYRGAIYPGKHEALVSPETWQKVQDLLSAKNLAGEKQREHPHYLKGSIHCGTCGARLMVNYAKGRRGGIYPYFVCIGRQKDKHSCSQRALRIELIEEAVADYYATVQLPEDELVTLRAFLEEEMSNLRLDSEHERIAQERRKQKLESERKALLDAHLAEAVPLDLLKSKQDGITAELAVIDGRLAEIAADFQKAEANLKRALARVGDCETAYREASDVVRRQFNLAFFARLLIDEDYTVRGELAPPFDVILGDELRRRAAIAKADEDTRAAIGDALRQRHVHVEAENEQRPQAVLVGADSPTTPSEVVGWSQINMVELGGLEPPTSWVRCQVVGQRIPLNHAGYRRSARPKITHVLGCFPAIRPTGGSWWAKTR
jgi:site-specific DNA recombinase